MTEHPNNTVSLFLNGTLVAEFAFFLAFLYLYFFGFLRLTAVTLFGILFGGTIVVSVSTLLCGRCESSPPVRDSRERQLSDETTCP